MLRSFPSCELIGLDVDESMLVLAEARLAEFGRRARILQADLRGAGWLGQVGQGFDAAVSATALHWLSPDHLAQLYGRVAEILSSGGIFLNADHVGSHSPAIQQTWQTHRGIARQAEQAGRTLETWDEFWQAYSTALGVDANTVGEKAVGAWEGVEDGMPLAWHFDRLREAAFTSIDCFWRSDCDAVYGGVAGRGDAT
jgi:cyclopropane fatty-acyl-phospholipid synthase-like methyltransferase